MIDGCSFDLREVEGYLSWHVFCAIERRGARMILLKNVLVPDALVAVAKA
jgi:hypothetical protein